jgi:nucleotide-binding universal stress UspA family protein
MKLKAKMMLSAKKQQEIGSSNIIAKTYVTYSNPADKILEFAEKHQSDLIVIGNVGLNGLSRIKSFALGNVSRRASKC